MDFNNTSVSLDRKIKAVLSGPETGRFVFLVFSLLALSLGISNEAYAAGASFGFELFNSEGVENFGTLSQIDFDGDRIEAAVGTVFAFVEGPFGALVMVVSGLGAIMSSAFGQYKASLNCLVVAIGSFILKAFVKTFFGGLSVLQEG